MIKLQTILERYKTKEELGSLQIAILVDDIEYPNNFFHQVICARFSIMVFILPLLLPAIITNLYNPLLMVFITISQLAIVSRRTIRNLIRNPMTSVAQLVTMITFGILMGLIYFQLNLTIDGVQNR